MNRILLYPLVMLLVACQSPVDKGYFNIDGTFDTDLEGSSLIELHKAHNGKTHVVASAFTTEANAFSFRLPATDPGMYTMHVKSPTAKGQFFEYRTTQNALWRFYLKGGDHIKIKASENGYELTESNNIENEKLTQWNHMADSLFMLAKKDMPTYKEYFPLLEEFMPQAKALGKTLTTGNDAFDKLLSMFIEVDLDDFPISFIFSPNSIHPKVEEFSPFYQTIISKDKLTDTFLLNHPRGHRFIGSYAQFGTFLTDEYKDRASYTKNRLKYIPNDTLKGYLLADGLRYFRCYDDIYINFMKEYGKYFMTEDLKQTVKKFEESIKVFGKGDPAFNFTAQDINGKDFKLADFKGKPVYIDLWATWCGPCKQEIPHLKKLEKKMAGKDIVFLKVSLDKNKAAWEKWVKEHKSKGYSLHLEKAFDAEFTKYYKIGSIPRFMLIDKAGKIVSIDAPRPSDPLLAPMLESLL